jgi:hypothetical protein
VCPACFSAIAGRLQPGRASSAKPRNLRRCHETGPDRRLGHCRRSRTWPDRLLREQSGEPGQFPCGEPPRGHELAGPVAGPAITFAAIDDRGQEQQSITFLGTFSRCDDPMPPKQFVIGKTYQSCLAYLIPGGGSIQRVQWDNGPAAANEVTPYFDRPIVWG